MDWQFEAADVAARAELAAVKARLRAPIRSSHRLSLRELASLALL